MLTYNMRAATPEDIAASRSKRNPLHDRLEHALKSGPQVLIFSCEDERARAKRTLATWGRPGNSQNRPRISVSDIGDTELLVQLVQR